ncbi:MAG: methyltransferase [Herbaspirillum sp.]|jgi:putative Mg2+ transporter-C (MgtC) family protein|nr:methyltransferase [Herbaspirillum sp.]
MRFIDSFHLLSFLNTLVSVATAFVLGGMIGFERQYRQRTAGLRTNVLVAVGAAVFVDLAGQVNGSAGTSQVIAYVVSGVGFLGAGTIMKDGMNIQGLNTAATLWGSAAVGACAGAGMIAEAALAAFFVLGANTLLRPIVNSINRTPINELSSELTYQMCIITTMDEQKQALLSMEQMLDVAKYPIGDMSVEPFGDDDVEIRATLMSTSVDADDLDRIIFHLTAKPYVSQAYWNPVTSE